MKRCKCNPKANGLITLVAENLLRVIAEQDNYLKWSNEDLDKALLMGESGNLTLRQKIQCVDTATRVRARAIELFEENVGMTVEEWKK